MEMDYAIDKHSDRIVRAKGSLHKGDYVIRYPTGNTFVEKKAVLSNNKFICEDIDINSYNSYFIKRLLLDKIVSLRSVVLPCKIVPMDSLSEGLKISDSKVYKAKTIKYSDINYNRIRLDSISKDKIIVSVVDGLNELKNEVRWFQKYKRDSIIYNIECIRPKDNLIGEDIEDRLTRLIQANNGVIWGYNSEIADVLSWYSGLLRFELSKSNYTADGNWYFWVDDKKKVDRLLNCPYKHSLNDSSNANKRHNKYLTEKTCKHCTHKLFDTWNGTYGLLVCNHSKVSNSDILKLLYRLNNF